MKQQQKEGYTVASNDTKIALLEQSIGHISQTLLRIEKRFDHLEAKTDKRFDDIEKKIDHLEAKTDKRFEIMDLKIENGFRDVNNRTWYLFYWMIAGFAGMLGLLAHVLKWI